MVNTAILIYFDWQRCLLLLLYRRFFSLLLLRWMQDSSIAVTVSVSLASSAFTVTVSTLLGNYSLALASKVKVDGRTFTISDYPTKSSGENTLFPYSWIRLRWRLATNYRFVL
jgi:hypothetical protein